MRQYPISNGWAAREPKIYVIVKSAGVTQLEELDLSGARHSDKGMKQPRSLDLYRTKITNGKPAPPTSATTRPRGRRRALRV